MDLIPRGGSGSVPRVSPRELRASDVDRERTVELLRQAAGDGRLTLVECEERMEFAYAARTLGELARLATDLVGPREQPVRTESDPLLALFGSDERSGRWVVPERLPATAVFGEVKLDLRQALLQRRAATVAVTALFGNVSIMVPEGVQVRLTGPAILGSKSSKVRNPAGPANPDAPVIEVRCFILFGTVTARSPKRGWLFGRRRRAGTEP